MVNVHLGHIIKQKVNERNLSIAEFALRIHRSRTTVYDIFQRKSIDVDLLLSISEALDFDFLSEVYLSSDDKPIPGKCFLAIEVDPSEVPARIKDIAPEIKNRMKIMLQESTKI